MIELFNVALIHGRILFRFKHLHSVHKVCPLLHKELTLIDKLLQLLHSLAWQLVWLGTFRAIITIEEVSYLCRVILVSLIYCPHRMMFYYTCTKHTERVILGREEFFQVQGVATCKFHAKQGLGKYHTALFEP